MYAGGIEGSNNTEFYLYTTQNWWGISPFSFSIYYAEEIAINSGGNINFSYASKTYGLRPSVSLASTSTITQGDGTATNPYVVE